MPFFIVEYDFGHAGTGHVEVVEAEDKQVAFDYAHDVIRNQIYVDVQEDSYETEEEADEALKELF